MIMGGKDWCFERKPIPVPLSMWTVSAANPEPRGMWPAVNRLRHGTAYRR